MEASCSSQTCTPYYPMTSPPGLLEKALDNQSGSSYVVGPTVHKISTSNSTRTRKWGAF